jgi:hypothetical protein
VDASDDLVDDHFVGQFVDHHGELVTTDSSQGVAGAKDAVHPGRDLEKYRVSGFVPRGLIDLLEAVQAHQQDAHVAVVAGPPGKSVGQPVAQHDPIGQAGERILESLAAELLLQDLSVRDIAAVPQVSIESGIAQLVGQCALERQPSSVLVHHPCLEADRVVRRRPDRSHRRTDERQVVGVDALGEEHGVTLGSQRVIQRRAAVGDASLGTGDDDDVGGAVQERLETRYRHVSSAPPLAVTCDEQRGDGDGCADQQTEDPDLTLDGGPTTRTVELVQDGAVLRRERRLGVQQSGSGQHVGPGEITGGDS